MSRVTLGPGEAFRPGLSRLRWIRRTMSRAAEVPRWPPSRAGVVQRPRSGAPARTQPSARPSRSRVIGRETRPVASRKSGVLRAMALTRAPSAMPSSNGSAVELVEEPLGERQGRRARLGEAGGQRARLAAPARHRAPPGVTSPAALRLRPPTAPGRSAPGRAPAFSPASRRSSVMTIAGTNPRWISGIAELGDSRASTRSHAVARPAPPASARPCTTATTGLGSSRMPGEERRPAGAPTASFSAGVRSAEASSSSRSAPAQKSFPAPRSTTTRTSASRSARSSACVQPLDQLGAERVALVGPVRA